MKSILGKLEKVELRQIWQHEASHFTPWLSSEDNLSLLGEVIGMDLELVSQEERVGPYAADLLCRETSEGRYVVIENQLEATDHKHLGQLLTYAAGLEATAIVWIAETFTEEHRAALDWLNHSTHEEVNFFGLEIEVLRIGDSQPAPRFNLVSKPNDWQREVRRNAEAAPVTETKLKQQEYWAALKQHMESKKSFLRMQKPQPQHWANLAIGRSGFTLNALVNTKEDRVTVALLLHGTDAGRHFELLRETSQAECEEEIGETVLWEPRGQKQYLILCRLEEADPVDESDWPRQHEWVRVTLEKFHSFFQSKIKALP